MDAVEERKSALSALLKGDRLGPVPASVLSKLATHARVLAATPHSKASLMNECKRALDISRELRVGGCCKHGGDQGPQCARCTYKGVTVLQGEFAAAPKGLDWAMHELGQIKQMGGKGLARLGLELDRVGEALDECDRVLRAVQRECAPAAAATAAAAAAAAGDKPAKQAKSVLEVVSINRIKTASGVDPTRLAEACDLAQSELAKRSSPRTADVVAGDVAVTAFASQPVPQSIATVDDLASEVRRRVRAMTGRELVEPVRFRRKGAAVFLDRSALLDDFETKLALEVANPCATHAAPLECFQRVCSSSFSAAPQPAAIVAQLAKSTPASIEVNYVPGDVPAALFTSLSYSVQLESLSLRGVARLSVPQLVEALRTLPNLKSLDVSFSCRGASALPLFSLWSEAHEAAALESLDLAGWSLCEVDSDVAAVQQTFDALAAAVLSLNNLATLVLEGCVRADRDCSQVVCDSLLKLFQSRFAGWRRFSFGGNRLCEAPRLRQMLAWMTMRSTALDLAALELAPKIELSRAWQAVCSATPVRLVELNLAGCELGDGGADALAHALGALPQRVFPELRVLNVRACGIAGDAMKRLLDAPIVLDALDVAFNPGRLERGALQARYICMDAEQADADAEFATREPVTQRIVVYDNGAWRTLARRQP